MAYSVHLKRILYYISVNRRYDDYWRRNKQLPQEKSAPANGKIRAEKSLNLFIFQLSVVQKCIQVGYYLKNVNIFRKGILPNERSFGERENGRNLMSTISSASLPLLPN